MGVVSGLLRKISSGKRSKKNWKHLIIRKEGKVHHLRRSDLVIMIILL